MADEIADEITEYYAKRHSRGRKHQRDFIARMEHKLFAKQNGYYDRPHSRQD